MSIDLYRRHTKACPHRAEGIQYTQCRCPIYTDGKHPVTGGRLRRGVGTRDWARARKILDRWISEQKANPEESAQTERERAPSLGTAVKMYLADCKARNLAASTRTSYTKTLGHLVALTMVHDVSELKAGHIEKFRNARVEADGRKYGSTSPRTVRKELECVRGFCHYLVKHKWLEASPSDGVGAPRDTAMPTMPFSPDEVRRLLGAVDQIDNNYKASAARARLRAKGLVLLLLYSGLRIIDVILLERTRLADDGRLLIRMTKTSEPLYVRIPEVVIEALRAIPVESPYFLWSGKSKVSSATGSARRTIDCLGALTGINAHPHRFRDTFSVELLKTGASLRDVQLLLGHKSIKTTEKHYAPYVVEFQQQLDRATARLKFAS